MLIAAQEEMGKLDVLVCGQCHSVFHFIEEFQDHRTKEGACTQVSHFRENSNVSNIHVNSKMFAISRNNNDSSIFVDFLLNKTKNAVLFFIERTESTSMGFPFMERFTDPSGKLGQRFNEFMEAVSKMVQNGYAYKGFLDRSRENHSNIYKDQQRENAGRAEAESNKHKRRRWIFVIK